MKIKELVDKALSQGWEPQTLVDGYAYPYDGGACYRKMQTYHELLDPLFWQAVGKSEGWEAMTSDTCRHCGRHYPIGNQPEAVLQWKVMWHRMIDALADGKTIEEFISTL